MSTAGKLFRNGLMLALAALCVQTAAMGFNVWLSGKIGAEGMGLFSLISAAYRFAMTFSLSGIGLAATRLAAEEFARGSGRGALLATVKCAVYALCFSLAACFTLFVSSDFVSVRFLHDARSAPSLRMLALALPPLSVSAAFDGYFTAKRSVKVTAASLLAEQFLRMGVTVALVELVMPPDIEHACTAVSVGITVSEAASFVFVAFSCLFDRRRTLRESTEKPSPGQTKRLLAIAVPIAISSYLRSGISTFREVLIPSGLKKHGGSYEQALASYGVIKGMTLPLIRFPAAFLDAFSGLLMPEMARYYQLNQRVSIRHAAERVLRVTLLFSIGTSAMLTGFSYDLGALFYRDNAAAVGRTLLLIGPCVFVMYLDTAVDSMLKGLNEQLANVRYNLMDSSLCLALVALFVPRFGIGAYLFVIVFSEFFNTTLSLRRLKKVTGLHLDFKRLLLMPGACAVLAVFVSRLPAFLTHTQTQPPLSAILSLSAGVLLYLVLLRLTRTVGAEDIATAKDVLKN